MRPQRPGSCSCSRPPDYAGEKGEGRLRCGSVGGFGFPYHVTPARPISQRVPNCEPRGVLFVSSLSRRHRAAVEVGMLAALYAPYQVVRGAGDTNLTVARDHTADIVSLEHTLHVFSE